VSVLIAVCTLQPYQLSMFWRMGRFRLQSWFIFLPENVTCVFLVVWWWLDLKNLWNSFSICQGCLSHCWVRHHFGLWFIQQCEIFLHKDTAWFFRTVCWLASNWHRIYDRNSTKIAFSTYSLWRLRSFAPQRTTNVKKSRLFLKLCFVRYFFCLNAVAPLLVFFH